jgi:hypothetical protein
MDWLVDNGAQKIFAGGGGCCDDVYFRLVLYYVVLCGLRVYAVGGVLRPVFDL